MVLVPNPRYTGPDKATAKIELSLIEQPFVTDDGLALRAYESNQVDYADVPFGEIDRIRSDTEMSKQLHIASKLRPVWVNFDTKHAPWTDRRVRQAFTLAIDRRLLATAVFKGVYQPIGSLIPPSLLPEPARSQAPGFDVERARRLLAEAGFTGGRGFPEFTLDALSSPTNRLLAPALQQQWEKNLGITTMKAKLLERKTYDELVQKTYKDHPFDVTIGGLTADYLDPAAYFDTWLSSRQEFYNNHWVNQRYDKVVAQADEESDVKKRELLYTQANQILAEDAPAIPLWLDGWAYVRKSHVQSFDFAFSNLEPTFASVRLG